MFQTVPLSIIRSSSLYTQQWYMSHKFADLYHIQRNCLKHVEFYSKNKFKKLVPSSWFYCKNLSRCTVTWTSKNVFMCPTMNVLAADSVFILVRRLCCVTLFPKFVVINLKGCTVYLTDHADIQVNKNLCRWNEHHIDQISRSQPLSDSSQLHIVKQRKVRKVERTHISEDCRMH